MKQMCLYTVIVVASAFAQKPAAVLQGTVTDPSGASVPNAEVAVTGPAGEVQSSTNNSGKYTLSIDPGTYVVRISASGFAASESKDVSVRGVRTLDVSLTIEETKQVMNVEDQANQNVSTDPTANGTALVLGQKELAALSDDPDELEQELQAMAGPGAGPNGGQIYIDGFTGGNMPPKASIREVRINSNPYSTEYDRPGFGRIEILTKPGYDSFHGQAFFQFNNEDLNSRNPLLTESGRAPYRNLIGGLNLGGPIIKNKMSFGFDFERRDITENAFVLASTLDSHLNPTTLSEAVVTPQTRMSFVPRLDYTINEKNTLVVRYQNTSIGLDNSGVGGYNLTSTGYNVHEGENTLQLTETAVLSPTTINETRFQLMRTSTMDSSANSAAAVTVSGAFSDGGATIGNSANVTDALELTNATTWTHGTHTWKLGSRVRESFNHDKSLNNFNGTYTFFGGTGPELDSADQIMAGTLETLTALDVYQRTLLGLDEGLTWAQIRELGGGASQYTLTSGRPALTVDQFDIGMFFNDDWRIKPNLTLSYGLRYETQTNIHDYGDIAPRFAIAWGIDGKGTKAARTVLRTGFGVFYDRIADTVTLNRDRYNGLTQQSYIVTSPDFFGTAPSLSSLASYGAPQQLQLVSGAIAAPRNYQGSIGLDRQINRYVKLSGQYIESRGVHLVDSRNINTPVDGLYPYGDSGIRLLTETAGVSRSHQLFLSPNINYKKMFLFGFYALSYGKDDNETQPANPYNLRAEWGPSTIADVRNRFIMGTAVPLPWRLSLSPFMIASSGTPFNITTGQDNLLTGVAEERPSLETGVSASGCSGTNLVYEAGYGCFNLNPAAGTAISRNYGRGPATFSLNMRLSRTWSFGDRGESGIANQSGPPPGMGGVRGGGGPPPGGGPGGGGPPPGMFGASSGKKYNLTFTVSARNILNHPSYSAPIGNLSSPFFGESTSLAGFGPMGASTTYDRKVDMQLRFQF